jgi:two-component system NtrC family sensor kinase
MTDEAQWGKIRMSVMHWSVSYYTGLPEVDRQHEALFGLVNRLYDARGHRAELLDQAFADLRDYVREHFSLEEALMAESGLDAGYIARHRAAHENFVMRVDELWGISIVPGASPPPMNCWASSWPG